MTRTLSYDAMNPPLPATGDSSATGAFPHPDRAPDAWDQCVLADWVLPGVAFVEVFPEDEIDVKKPKGRSGARVTYQGADATKVKVKLHIWTEDQFADFMRNIGKIRPKEDRGERRALSIRHPTCALWGVRSVLFHKAHGPKRPNPREAWVVELELLEVRDSMPGKSVAKTPKALTGEVAWDEQGNPKYEVPTPDGELISAPKPSKKAR